MNRNAPSVPTPAPDCPQARCRAMLRAIEQSDEAPVALAVSGGMDSMVLLHAFPGAAEETTFPRSRILVLHVNHHLRASASADEDLVRDTTSRLGLAAEFLHADLSDTGKGSLEARARQVRYSLLYSAMKRAGARWLLTAHHRDDQAETIMLQHMRGTGLLGLGGMPATRFLVAGRPQRLCRPFLDLSRHTLEDWARSRDIRWRDDLSNRTLTHRRNLVRHLILPYLEKQGLHRDELTTLGRGVQECMQTIVRLAILAERNAGIVVTSAPRGSTAKMPLNVLKKLPAEVAFHLLERQLSNMGAPAGSLSHDAFARIVTAAEPGDVRELRRNLHVRLLSQEGELFVEARLRKQAPDRGEVGCETVLRPPTKLVVEGLGTLEVDLFEKASPPHAPDELWIPAGAVRGNLVLRSPGKGERMQPLGMSGTRLLADLLREARIPAEERWRRPIIADEEGPLWLPGIRPSERCRVLHHQGPFLRLRLAAVPQNS